MKKTKSSDFWMSTHKQDACATVGCTGSPACASEVATASLPSSQKQGCFCYFGSIESIIAFEKYFLNTPLSPL
ncbi:MAG: hypothetical protein N2517_08715 [Ignavibacteria bacterium]|nr:hypothetical protein [Ignavibacteria bacterium]